MVGVERGAEAKGAFWAAATSPRVLASYKLSFGASLIAAAINLVFGLILAWCIVRYEFPGKKLVDALIDLPFALLFLGRRAADVPAVPEAQWRERWVLTVPAVLLIIGGLSTYVLHLHNRIAYHREAMNRMFHAKLSKLDIPDGTVVKVVFD